MKWSSLSEPAPRLISPVHVIVCRSHPPPERDRRSLPGPLAPRAVVTRQWNDLQRPHRRRAAQNVAVTRVWDTRSGPGIGISHALGSPRPLVRLGWAWDLTGARPYAPPARREMMAGAARSQTDGVYAWPDLAGIWLSVSAGLPVGRVPSTSRLGSPPVVLGHSGIQGGGAATVSIGPQSHCEHQNRAIRGHSTAAVDTEPPRKRYSQGGSGRYRSATEPLPK